MPTLQFNPPTLTIKAGDADVEHIHQLLADNKIETLRLFSASSEVISKLVLPTHVRKVMAHALTLKATVEAMKLLAGDKKVEIVALGDLTESGPLENFIADFPSNKKLVVTSSLSIYRFGKLYHCLKNYKTKNKKIPDIEIEQRRKNLDPSERAIFEKVRDDILALRNSTETPAFTNSNNNSNSNNSSTALPTNHLREQSNPKDTTHSSQQTASLSSHDSSQRNRATTGTYVTVLDLTKMNAVRNADLNNNNNSADTSLNWQRKRAVPISGNGNSATSKFPRFSSPPNRANFENHGNQLPPQITPERPLTEQEKWLMRLRQSNNPNNNNNNNSNSNNNRNRTGTSATNKPVNALPPGDPILSSETQKIYREVVRPLIDSTQGTIYSKEFSEAFPNHYVASLALSAVLEQTLAPIKAELQELASIKAQLKEQQDKNTALEAKVQVLEEQLQEISAQRSIASSEANDATTPPTTPQFI